MNEKVLKTASKWALGTTSFREPNHLWLIFSRLQNGRNRLLCVRNICALGGKDLRASYTVGWIKRSHSVGKTESQSSVQMKCLPRGSTMRNKSYNQILKCCRLGRSLLKCWVMHGSTTRKQHYCQILKSSRPGRSLEVVSWLCAFLKTLQRSLWLLCAPCARALVFLGGVLFEYDSAKENQNESMISEFLVPLTWHWGVQS